MSPADPGPTGLAREWVTVEASDAVETAWAALGGVYDPELCLDVVSLGLVYDIRAESATLVVEMTLTTPGCPVSDSLPEQARAAIIDATDGAVGVDVRVVWDPPWSPAMMNEAAAAALGFGAR
ncbi:MAG TPA: iron-sulfur cluster assembly protein [Acidimicrobiales bacterium]|nr:iron-sulfur cluster assembly protein [Acidimicrobiales bacterium]